VLFWGKGSSEACIECLKLENEAVNRWISGDGLVRVVRAGRFGDVSVAEQIAEIQDIREEATLIFRVEEGEGLGVLNAAA